MPDPYGRGVYGYAGELATQAHGADDKFFDTGFVSMHVPESATPKDGPSAGVTRATALLSLAKKRQDQSSAGDDQ